jgi:hypothetical protein
VKVAVIPFDPTDSELVVSVATLSRNTRDVPMTVAIFFVR